MAKHTVIVGNIGTVVSDDSWSEAKAAYEEYCHQSRTDYGRAAGEDVTWLMDGEPYKGMRGSMALQEDREAKKGVVNTKAPMMLATGPVAYESDDAAHFVKNISGWVSRHGRFYGKDGEHNARYDGCTVRKCKECTELCSKSYTICETCREKKADAAYAAREKQEWDGKAALYSQAFDEYLFDEDDVDRLCDEHDADKSDLQLLICVPHHYSLLDVERWYDEVPEDGDAPAELVEAVDTLNEVVKTLPQAYWVPGKFATDG